MASEEFEAPEWVKNEEELKPLTSKQKRIFIAALSVIIPFCLWAGWYEWNRAQEGHWRAWVYAFEWPFFAAVSIYMFRRFLHGDRPKIPRPKFDFLEEDKHGEKRD